MSRTFCGAALLLAAFSAPAMAHPFHGAGSGFAAGVSHPFLGLDHLLAMVAVGVWAAQASGRALWAVPLAFVGTMMAGGLLGVCGMALPHVEPLIAASVLVLGLLIFFNWRAGALPGVLLAAFFALFHGLAHGAELPLHDSAAAYVLGFVLATSALHLAGIAIAAALRHRELRLRLTGIPVALAGCWFLAQSVI
jgi:urease accessory protein